MSIFAVVLRERNERVVARLRNAYEDHFSLSSTFFLVPSDELSSVVATTIGIKGDDRVEDSNGVVFKITDAYSGYTTKALWEWLNNHEDEF